MTLISIRKVSVLKHYMAELICERYIFKYNCNTYKT